MTKLEEVIKAMVDQVETGANSIEDLASAAVKSLKLEVPSHTEKPYAHMRAILWNDQIDAILNEEQK